MTISFRCYSAVDSHSMKNLWEIDTEEDFCHHKSAAVPKMDCIHGDGKSGSY